MVIRAIFARVSREDPKPGRWILPLVVAGLIGFTYVFVNALPAAEVSTTSTPGTTSSTTTTSTAEPTSTTTTTLEPTAAALIDELDQIESDLSALADRAQQINDDWDTDSADFGPTRDGLQDLEVQTITLADDTAGLEDAPAIAEWDEVLVGFEDLKTAAADMIDGLLNAPGSEPRLLALDEYKIAAATITNAIREVRASLR